MNLVFVHGWGSGPFVWKDILPSFESYNCTVVNLGFLGEENLSVPDEKFIGIGHSLGGAWLLKHYPERLSGFISIASFNCFYQHIPQHILSKMRKNIAKDMTAQLQDFWHHAGLDHPGGFKNLKPLKLIEGLGWLSKWNADIPTNISIKILASHDDHIVPEKMTQDIWKNYDIEWVDEGGHMLPITQPEWCTKHIENFIDDFK